MASATRRLSRCCIVCAGKLLGAFATVPNPVARDTVCHHADAADAHFRVVAWQADASASNLRAGLVPVQSYMRMALADKPWAGPAKRHVGALIQAQVGNRIHCLPLEACSPMAILLVSAR